MIAPVAAALAQPGVPPPRILVTTLTKGKVKGFKHMNYWKRSIYAATAARTQCFPRLGCGLGAAGESQNRNHRR